MISVHQIDTATSAPGRRLDCWNQTVGDLYSGISIDSKQASFKGKALHAKIGQLGLSRIVTDESSVNRTPPSHLGNHEEDYLKLHLQNGGFSLNRQGNREALLNAGEITVCENKTPYSIETSCGSDIYALSIPLTVIHSVLPDLEHQIMRVFNGYGLHGRLLFNMLHTIYNECLSPLSSVDNTEPLQKAILELVGSIMSEPVSNTVGPGDITAQQHQLERLKTLVQENLHKPELTTEFIAQEAGLSERRIQVLFSSIQITPTSYIRNQRLFRATEYLQFEPNLSITQIAYRTGFNDSAYFTRCFKQHYAETPKSYRARYSQLRS